MVSPHKRCSGNFHGRGSTKPSWQVQAPFLEVQSGWKIVCQRDQRIWSFLLQPKTLFFFGHAYYYQNRYFDQQEVPGPCSLDFQILISRNTVVASVPRRFCSSWEQRSFQHSWGKAHRSKIDMFKKKTCFILFPQFFQSHSLQIACACQDILTTQRNALAPVLLTFLQHQTGQRCLTGIL